MFPDFTETYRSYSDEALVQMVAHPEGYPPEFVAAAKAVLDERGVVVPELYEQPHPVQETPAIKYEDGQTGIFEEMTVATLSAQTKKRIQWISILWGCMCLFNMAPLSVSYYTVRKFMPVNFVFWSIFGAVITLLFPLLIIYQLSKRKKWGWLLAVFILTIFVAAQAQSSVRILSMHIASANPIMILAYYPIFALAMYTTFLVLLLGRQFRSDFSITDNVAWRPVAIALLISLLAFIARFQ